MNASRTCACALLVVAIVPVILGFCWPTGTVTEDIWEVEQGIDITDSLNNRQIDVWDYYRGPLNNLSRFHAGPDNLTFPVATRTDTPNNYPIAPMESYQYVDSVDFNTLSMSGKARYVMFGNLSLTGDQTIYDWADYWPNTNTLILTKTFAIGSDSVKTVSPKAGDQITGSHIYLVTFGAPTGYIDLKKGLTGNSDTMGWTNELRNRSVEMWVQLSNSESVTIDGLRIERGASGLISATYGGVTKTLGSAYPFISVIFDMEKIEVRGLIGVEDFTTSTYTIGNVVTFEAPRDSEIMSLTMVGYSYHYWIKQTVTAISSTKGISDSGVVPDSYYPTHSWQLEIVNPATFGRSLSIGPLTYPITDGSITVTNIDTGESSTIPVRGLRILSLVLNGQQEISVGGVTVLRQSAQSTMIVMNGEWYASVVLSKVDQSTSDRFVWTSGFFNFSKSAYCVTGLLACAGVAVLGSLWNRNKESTIPLYIVMAAAGAVYFIMMG